MSAIRGCLSPLGVLPVVWDFPFNPCVNSNPGVLGQGGVERADGVGYPFWNYTLEWRCRTLAALSARGFNSPGGSSLREGETSWSF